MKKKQEDIIDKVFPAEQRKLIKKAIVKTEELTENLSVSIIRIGTETSLLLLGKDFNDNVQFTMLSEDTFNKLKKLKIKGA